MSQQLPELQEESSQQSKAKLEYLQQLLEEQKNFRVLNKNGGSGSFGQVLFVEDVGDSSKKYAIKVQSILKDNTTDEIDEDKQKECEQEAEIMRQCKHKNIVKIHSEFIIGSDHFIQMNLCQSSLGNWITKNKKRISDSHFAHNANQILDGIDYFHQQNYILRDLSINNILITTEGVIELCDFGLVQKLEEENMYNLTHQFKGAYLYLPPEIRENLINEKPFNQTKEGDIWAFGVCLSLFGGLDSQFYLKFTSDYVPDESPYFSYKANQIIKYIMNKDPEMRPNVAQIRKRIFKDMVEIENDDQDDNIAIDKPMFFSQTQKFQQQNIPANMNKSSFPSSNPSFSKNTQNQKETFLNSLLLEYDNEDEDEDDQETNKIKIRNTNGKSSKQLLDQFLHKKAFIDRIIDYDFKEGEELYQKYQDFLENNAENIDALITIGFIESKSFSNHRIAEKYFQSANKLMDTDVDVYLGLCEVQRAQRQKKNIRQGQVYLSKCIEIKSSYWRIYYYSFLLSYMENQLNLDNLNSFIEKLRNLDVKSFLIQTLETAIMIKNRDKSEALEKNIAFLKDNNKSNDIFVFEIIADYFIWKQNWQEAEQYSMEMLKYSKDDIKALTNLVYIYKQLNLQDKKNQYIQKLKILYQDNSLVWETIADTEALKDSTLNLLVQAKSLDPSNERFVIKIGDLILQRLLFDEAILEYKKALDLQNDSEAAMLQIAQAYHKAKNYTESLKYFKLANSMYPKNTETWLQLGNLYFLVNNLEESKVYAKKYEEVNPNSKEVYRLLYMIVNKQQNLTLVTDYRNIYINLLKKDIEGGSYEDCITLGRFYEFLCDYKSAKESYQKCVEIKEDYYLGHYLLATILFKENPHDEFITTEITRAIELQPTLEAFLMKSELLSQQQNYRENIVCLKEALSIFGQNEILYYKIAQSYFKLKLYDNCKKSIEDALKFKPDHKEYINLASQTLEILIQKYPFGPQSEANKLRLCDMYLMLKDKDSLLELLDQIIEHNPQCVKALDMLGTLYQNIDPEEALKYYQKLLGIVQTPQLYTKIGKVYKQLCKIDLARQNYLISIQLNQDYQNAYYQLGLLYLNIEQSIAIKCFVKAAELNPKDSLPYLQLAQLYYQTSYYLSAREAAQKALEINPDFEQSEKCLEIISFSQNKVGKGRWDKPVQLQESDFAQEINQQLCSIF